MRASSSPLGIFALSTKASRPFSARPTRAEKAKKKGPVSRPLCVSVPIPTGSGDLLIGLERRRLGSLGRRQLLVARGRDLTPARHDAAGARRDKAADDDVL